MIDFQFVHVDASSANARKRTHQLARAHAARTHRRKRRDDLIDITVYKPSELPIVTAKATKSIDSEAVKPAEKALSKTPATLRIATPNAQDASPIDSVIERLLSPPPTKPLSPVFGALAPKTFQPGASLLGEQVAHYLMNVVFHNRLTHENALQRFRIFCEEPMMYHVFHYCVAIYHDQVDSSLLLSRQPEMLWHKAEAIRLLNESLSSLNERKLDMVICTIMYLTGLEFEKWRSKHTLLFRPYRWQSPWPWVDGQKRAVKAHFDALQVLVGKRGGIFALQMPGLALSIARVELVYASLWMRRPVFPCFWTLDEDTVAAYEAVQASAPELPARGLSAIAGMLPFEVLDVLINIAHTERLLSDQPGGSSLREAQREAARCIAHHQLLCIPAWDDTDGIYSEWADETVYECCRLTAILYSNAVVLGLPPHVGWQLQLCAQIRRHLEGCDMEDLSGDVPGLLIWVTYITCIAAYGSEHEGYFVSALRSAMKREGLESRQGAEQVLEGYLWAMETCREGGESVWKALEL